ncbi:MAG: tetratricopeptide repeat protein [Tenuifilaceae bacterium]
MKSLNLKSILLLTGLLCIFASSEIYSQDLESANRLTRSEQYDDAEAAFNQLIQKEPGNSKTYFFYGENQLLSYFSDTISNSLKALTDQAREIFNNGVKADSLNPLNFIGLSKVSFYLAKDDEAARLRSKAKRLLPPYKRVTKIANPQDYAFALAKLAESYIRNEKVDTSKALPLLREAISIDPKNPEIFIIAGDIYFLAKDGSNSIRNYNIANNLDKTRPTANMKIGSIYMKGRNLTAAIPYFEQAIKLNDKYAPAYRELGQLYSMAGRYEQSKGYFKTYLELTKGNIPAKIRYVNALFYAKEYDEVVTNVEEIFAIDQARTYLNRIAAYSSFEKNPPDYEKALSYMDKLFKNMSEDRLILKDYTYYAKILLKKNADYPKKYQDAARLDRDLARNQDRYETAKGDAKDRYKIQIDTLTNQIAGLKKVMADEDLELDKAFEAYHKAHIQAPGDRSLLNDIAVNLYNFKRFNESAKYFEKLIALGKNDVNDYMQVGKAYNQGKNYAKADSMFAIVIQQFPDYVQGYVWMANTYSAMDPDNTQGIAKPKFEMVIQKARTDSVAYASDLFNAYRFMGGDYFAAKNFSRARDYYNMIVNLTADNKDYKTIGYNSIGLTYYSSGEYDNAINAYSKTLEIDPKNQNASVSIKNINIAKANAAKKINPNELKGIIKDVYGKPIASASVRVRDTAAEAWTNANGEFAFEIPQGSEALLIGAKGFKTKEVIITKARIYNVSLEQQ